MTPTTRRVIIACSLACAVMPTPVFALRAAGLEENSAHDELAHLLQAADSNHPDASQAWERAVHIGTPAASESQPVAVAINDLVKDLTVRSVGPYTEKNEFFTVSVEARLMSYGLPMADILFSVYPNRGVAPVQGLTVALIDAQRNQMLQAVPLDKTGRAYFQHVIPPVGGNGRAAFGQYRFEILTTGLEETQQQVAAQFGLPEALTQPRNESLAPEADVAYWLLTVPGVLDAAGRHREGLWQLLAGQFAQAAETFKQVSGLWSGIHRDLDHKDIAVRYHVDEAQNAALSAIAEARDRAVSARVWSEERMTKTPDASAQSSTTGLEEPGRGAVAVRSDQAVAAAQVLFYRDFVRSDKNDAAPIDFIRNGLVREGESRAVVPTAQLPKVQRLFYDARLPRPGLMDVDMMAIPADAAEAVGVMQNTYKIQPGEIVLLPDDISEDAARQWQVPGVATPILLVPVAQLNSLSALDLAALAAIAQALDGQILRVRAETIVRARLDTDFYVSTQY